MSEEINGMEAPVDAGQAEVSDNTEPVALAEYEYIDPAAFDGKYIKVKVDGEELDVPLNEAIQGYQRQSDYTRKTQELATQREQLQYAQTLQQALDSNPQQTLELLSRHYGVDVANQMIADHNAQATPEFDDPLEERIYYLDQKIAAFEQQQAGEQLQKEISRLQSTYDDFNPMEVVRAALERGTNDLESVYKQIAFDRLRAAKQQATQVSAQQNQQVSNVKRDASFVATGSSSVAPTTTPAGKVGSVADAWALAKRQMGM